MGNVVIENVCVPFACWSKDNSADKYWQSNGIFNNLKFEISLSASTFIITAKSITGSFWIKSFHILFY